MKKILIITLIIVSLGSCSKNSNPPNDIFFKEGINRLTPPQTAPDFTLTNIDGDTVTLSDYKGKALFLNFWAEWCGPCTQEMPSIESLYQKTENLNIEVLAINVGESLETVSKFIESNNYNFTTLIDEASEAASSYGVRSIPSTFIINKDGNIIAMKLGGHEWDSNNIIEILKGASE